MKGKELVVAGSSPDVIRNESGSSSPAQPWKEYRLSKKRWERHILAAYMRVIVGASIDSVAGIVGCSASSVTRMAAHPSWEACIAEAEERWVVDMQAQSRAVLQDSIEGSGREAANNAKWFLERTVTRLAPPAQRTQVTGASGGPLQIVIGAAPAGLIRPSEDDSQEKGA